MDEFFNTRKTQDISVLVTGGAGSIGGHLVRALLEKGCRVTVIDDLSSGNTDNLPDSSRLRMIIGSVTNDDILSNCNDSYKIIFHLAAQFANQNSVDHPFSDLLTNAGGTIKILEFARKVKDLRKVVIASSSCVYGAVNGIISEDSPIKLTTPYAISKLAAEHYGMFYYRNYDLPITILRYFNSYGPGEHPGLYRNVIPNFFDIAMRGLPLPITGTGNETRTFTYVSDIVEGTILSAQSHEVIGKIFNLGSHHEVRIVELAEMINRLTGNSAGLEFRSRRSWDDVTRRAVSCEKAKRVFGYEPRVSLAKGLELTYQWFLEVKSNL